MTKWLHVHLVGGPLCGETMSVKGIEHDEDEYELPEALIIPINETEGELYILGDENAPCGYPRYLYGGYDWEPGLATVDF